MKSIVTVFESAISDTESVLAKFKAMHHGMSPFNPQAIPARKRFLARRVKLLQNILRWRKHAGEQFGLSSIVKRLVENCFLSIAEGGWEVGGEEFSRKVLFQSRHR